MAIRTDLLTQMDWRHYQPPQPEKESREPLFKKWLPLNLFTRPAKKSSVQEPPAATEGISNRAPRTIAQGLAAPEQTAYCQVAQLYNNVKNSLSDYPLWPPCWLTIAPTPHRITICRPLKRWT